MKIKTIIIGLGSAGAYDKFLDKNFSFGRNHLDCIKANKLFEIEGLIDPNKKKHEELHKKNKINKSLFSTKVSTLKKKKIDLVVISSPTKAHRQNIKDCLSLNPSVVICEKPLSDKISEIIEILEIIEKKKIKLVVNYQRQFDEKFSKLGKLFVKNKYNKFILKYNGGFLNNASHFIYYLFELYGKIKSYNTFCKTSIKDDKSFNLILNFEKKVQAICLGFDEANVDIFDVEAYNENSKIEILNGGHSLKYYEKKGNQIFTNYFPLVNSKLNLPNYGDGFENLYKRVANFFNDTDKLNEFSTKKYSYFYKQLESIRLRNKIFSKKKIS